jgi:hypothetical protein
MNSPRKPIEKPRFRLTGSTNVVRRGADAMGGTSAESPHSATIFSAGDDVVTWDLSMTTRTEAHLDQLARDIRGSREDVLRRALALLTVAVRAKREGKGIAIIDQEGHVDTEITGI